ncbi:PH domain-containing protein [soil metagenome]
MRFSRDLIPALIGVVATGLVVLIPVGLALLVCYRYLSWWRRTWSFDGTVLRFDSGVLSRNERRLPADRIQQVDIIRKLRHQVLGLAVLRVETAGGSGGAEVELDAIDHRQAVALRADLLGARDRACADGRIAEDGVAEVRREPTQPLVRLGVARLALAGVTGAQLLVMLTAVAWLSQVVDDVPDRLLGRVAPDDVAIAGPVAIGAAVLAGVAIWLGLAALTAVLTWYGLTVTRVGDELHVARGLFERREGVIPRHRVQVVRIQQGLLRRPFGGYAMRIQSAGGASGEAAKAAIPLLTAVEVDRLLGEIAPGVELPTLQPPPLAARRRAVVRRAGAAAALAAPLWLLGPAGTLGWGVLVGLGVVWGVDAYRGLGHGWVPTPAGAVLVARTGSVVRETTVTPVAKAQSARVTSSPRQRRAGLASVLVDVAGRGDAPRVADEGRTVALAVLADVIGEER